MMLNWTLAKWEVKQSKNEHIFSMGRGRLTRRREPWVVALNTNSIKSYTQQKRRARGVSITMKAHPTEVEGMTPFVPVFVISE